MSTYSDVRQAILDKNQVIAHYGGHYREMCPHAIGTKNGKEQALFYQFAGDTSKGPVTGDSKDNWRCMPISGLSNVSIKSGSWHTADNHSQATTCIDEIDVQVDY